MTPCPTHFHESHGFTKKAWRHMRAGCSKKMTCQAGQTRFGAIGASHFLSRQERSTKLQHPSTREAPNSNPNERVSSSRIGQRLAFEVLVLGVSLVLGAWMLELGTICMTRKKQDAPRPANSLTELAAPR